MIYISFDVVKIGIEGRHQPCFSSSYRSLDLSHSGEREVCCKKVSANALTVLNLGFQNTMADFICGWKMITLEWAIHSFIAGRCFTLLKRCLYSTSNKTKWLAQKASWQIEMKKAIIQYFTLSVNTLNHNVIVSDDPSIFLLLSV